MYPSFVFIRHGESVHNSRAELVQKNNKSNPDWKSTPEYRALKFDPALVDASLTHEGERQAESAIKSFDLSQVDVVVVSPLRRALETCDIIFGDRKDMKVYVEPLMAELLSSAVDIGGRIKDSRQVYGKKFDFGRIPEENEERWYLENLSSEVNRKMILDSIEKDKVEVNAATIEMMKIAPVETNLDLAKRAKLLKEQLIKYKQVSKKKVALVGHSYMFRMLTATGFYQDGEPINDVLLKNCEVREIPIIIEGYQEEAETVVPFCRIP